MMKQLPAKLRLVTFAEVDSSDDLLGELKSETHYTGAVRLIVISIVLILVALVWAWFGVLDEVSTGTGKVIPSSRDQVLQSLEGGILTELYVHEGDQVQAGQLIAKLDATCSQSSVAAKSSASSRSAIQQLTPARLTFMVVENGLPRASGACAPEAGAKPPRRRHGMENPAPHVNGESGSAHQY